MRTCSATVGAVAPLAVVNSTSLFQIGLLENRSIPAPLACIQRRLGVWLVFSGGAVV